MSLFMASFTADWEKASAMNFTTKARILSVGNFQDQGAGQKPRQEIVWPSFLALMRRLGYLILFNKKPM